MRLRFVVLASVLSAFALVAPGVANAAPANALSITATPNPIVSGDPVLIYGRLTGPNNANREIVLYHMVAGRHPFFTSAGATRTDANGFYEFTRAEHVVLTNRSWYVRAPFVTGAPRSATVSEQVAAAVSVGAFTPTGAATVTGDTSHSIAFIGHVDPPWVNRGQQVLLQQQGADGGDDWHTIDTGMIGAHSDFKIVHKFAVAGARNVRVLFPGDLFNTAAASDTVSLTIQQTQVPSFTIASATPIIDAGGSTTITGTLFLPGTGSSPGVAEPNVPVTLWATVRGMNAWQPIANGTTAGDGSYTFTVSPTQNTVYQVRTTFAPPAIRNTALLFVAVRDLVSITPSTTSTNVGQLVTFSGTVTPDQTGRPVYLERLGKDGDFHIIRISFVKTGSVYSFTWTPGTPGTHVLRVLVPGGNHNASGASQAVTVTVSLPTVSTLPHA